MNFLREPVLDPDTGEEIEAAPIIYEPVDSVEALRNRLLAGQKQYNDFNKVSIITAMNLILFCWTC